MRIRAWAVLGCMVAISACQSPSAPPPSSRPIEVPAAARAAVALGAGRYEEAATLYREALRLDPLAIPSHYGLAVALSYVDRSAAIREFQWVVINAPKDSPEAGEARAWLVRAGALPKTPVEQAAASTLERQRDNAALFGRAIMAEKGQPVGPVSRMQLFLVGQPDSPTKEERYNLRTAEDGTFKFPNVLPGPYMLTNRVAGDPTWRLRVVLKPSEERELNLGPGNNLSVQDDFPQLRQAKPPSG
jgi:tetratricopeptide (TPR) repeat protein